MPRARALLGGLTWRRWFTFSTAGVIGIGVQILCLWLLAGVQHLDPVPPVVGATELTVLHNFVWHLRWTWADRPSLSVEALARRDIWAFRPAGRERRRLVAILGRIERDGYLAGWGINSR
jgi:hypothetical protein